MDTRILEIILRAKDEASAAVQSATGKISGSFDKMVSIAKFAAGALIGVGAAATGLAIVGLKQAGELENLQVALETVAGSADAADRAMRVIRKTAQDSPFFETSTLAQFVQVMAAAGQNIDSAVQSGLRFGDVMAAFGKGNAELTRLGNTLSQVMGKGKADAVDFKELVNSGWVSVRKDTAAAMGVTIDKFEEMVSAGLIGYDQIAKAAEKYNGAAERQSHTFSALLQRVKESFGNALANIVTETGLFDVVKTGIDAVSNALDDAGRIVTMFIQIFQGVDPTLRPGEERFISIIKVLAWLYDTFLAAKEVITDIARQVVTFLAPSLIFLWQTIETHLLPSLRRFWEVAGPYIIPILKALAIIIGATLIVAIRLFISILTLTIETLAGLFNWIADTIQAVEAFIDAIKQAGLAIHAWATAAVTSIERFGKAVYSGVVQAVQDAQRHIDEFVAAFGRAWDTATAILSYVAANWPELIATGIGFVSGSIYRFATEDIPRAVDAIISFFTAIPGVVWAFLSSIPGIVESVFTAAKESAKRQSDQIASDVSGSFQSLWKGVTDWLNHTWQSVISIFNAIRSWVVSAVPTIIEAIYNAFASLPGRLVALGSAFGRAIVDALNSIPRYLGNAMAWASTIISNIGRAIYDKAGVLKEAFKAGWVAAGAPAFANGVRNFEGGVALVGERGPELVNLPRGSDVYSNSDSRSMLGGVNITIHANVSKDVDIQQLGQRLAWEMKLAGGF